MSLNVLAFSSATLSASDLTNALTSTSLRVSRNVSFSLSLLGCKQAHLSVHRLSHLMLCLQVFQPAVKLACEPACQIVLRIPHDQVFNQVSQPLSVIVF